MSVPLLITGLAWSPAPSRFPPPQLQSRELSCHFSVQSPLEGSSNKGALRVSVQPLLPDAARFIVEVQHSSLHTSASRTCLFLFTHAHASFEKRDDRPLGFFYILFLNIFIKGSQDFWPAYSTLTSRTAFYQSHFSYFCVCVCLTLVGPSTFPCH